jgi:hypothetical protein
MLAGGTKARKREFELRQVSPELVETSRLFPGSAGMADHLAWRVLTQGL